MFRAILAGNLTFVDHRHLKSAFPQMPRKIIDHLCILSAILMIIEGAGELYALFIPSSFFSVFRLIARYHLQRCPAHFELG